MKNQTKLLAFLALASILLYAGSFLPLLRRQQKPVAMQSAFLNPKYEKDWDRILIQHNQKELELKRQGDFWTVSDSVMTAPASKKRVEALIRDFSKIRKMYKIADRLNTGSYGVHFFTLSFYKNASLQSVRVKEDVNMSIKLYILPAFSATGLTSVYTAAPSAGYETEDSLSSYCSLDIASYAAEELFWGIGKPVSFDAVFNLQKAGSAAPASWHVNEGNPAFPDKAHGILALRHGGLSAPASLLSEQAAAAVTVADASGRRHALRLYEKNDGDAVSYLCESRLLPSPADSEETIAALESLAFQTEVSLWTFSRLQELITGEK